MEADFGIVSIVVTFVLIAQFQSHTVVQCITAIQLKVVAVGVVIAVRLVSGRGD